MALPILLIVPVVGAAIGAAVYGISKTIKGEPFSWKKLLVHTVGGAALSTLGYLWVAPAGSVALYSTSEVIASTTLTPAVPLAAAEVMSEVTAAVFPDREESDDSTDEVDGEDSTGIVLEHEPGEVEETVDPPSDRKGAPVLNGATQALGW